MNSIDLIGYRVNVCRGEACLATTQHYLINLLLFIHVLLQAACGMRYRTSYKWIAWLSAIPLLVLSVHAPPPAAGADTEQGAGGTLLIGIGVQIEAYGAVPSKLVPGATPVPTTNGLDYNNRQLFNEHSRLIRLLAAVVEKHGGGLTVQAQTPFTQVAADTGSTIFLDLQAHGHEIGLHFSEDAHLGANSESLPVNTWAEVMQAEIDVLEQTGVTTPIRYWSGGNLYPGILKAANRVGLDVMSDYRHPRTGQTSALVLGVNPWRPSAGPGGKGLAAFARNDPDGKVVYLPDGKYRRVDYVSRRAQVGDNAYFQYLTGELQNSLNHAGAGKVNVFHVTIRPGEFVGARDRAYALLDQWLTTVVDPLVKSGKLRWATFSEMADAYRAWELDNPNVDPRKDDVPGSQEPSVNPDRVYEVGPQFAGYYQRVAGAKVLGPAIGPVLDKAQYFEKGRLEDHSAEFEGEWAYAYGLLVPELIGSQAKVRIAGHAGPTYADLTAKVSAGARVTSPSPAGGLVNNPDGSVFVPFDVGLAGRSGHVVPAYFWRYVNNMTLFPGGWLHDTGLPMSEAFSIDVAKGVERRTVTVQVFERAILTYDPRNPVEFQVERANVGLAYRDAFPDRVLGR